EAEEPSSAGWSSPPASMNASAVMDGGAVYGTKARALANTSAVKPKEGPIFTVVLDGPAFRLRCHGTRSVQQALEVGPELGVGLADHLRCGDLDPRPAQPDQSHAHGDPVVVVGIDHHPAGGRPGAGLAMPEAVDGQAVGPLLDRGPDFSELARHGAQAV